MADPKEYKFTFEGDDLEEQDAPAADGSTPALPDVTNDDKPAKSDDPEIVFDDEIDTPAARAGVQADDDQALAPLPDEGAPANTQAEDPRIAAMAERVAQMEALLGKQRVNDAESQIATLDARHTAAIAAAQGKIETALEAGDVKAAAAAQVELARATQAEALHKARVEQWRESQKAEAQRPPQQVQQQREAAPAFDQKALQSWLTKNQWFHDQSGKYAKHQQLAKTIDEQVMADGFNPAHPKYYSELTSRLRTALKGSDPGEPRQPQKPAVGAPSRGASNGGAAPSNGKRIVLTADDRKMMDTLHIDTSNPKEVAAFAAAKAERLRNEARQAKTR